MPESWFATGPAIMAHEIGHVLGGNHPAVLRCQDFDDSNTCVIDANVNDRDLMSFGGSFYLMPNNYERLRWGWHPPGAFDNPSTGFVHMFDLNSPVIPFIKDGKKNGRFFFRYILTGTYSGGWAVFPEARRNWGQFENYRETDESFQTGLAVRIGHANYGDPEALSALLDPNDTRQVEDAPLRENQEISIGGVSIKCIREFNHIWGTRMRVR